jgi:hypothetical protein
MGSAQGKGAREDRQAEREISSQLPTRKEAKWSRRRRKGGSGMMKKSQRAQSERLQESFCNNVIECNVANIKVNTMLVSGK